MPTLAKDSPESKDDETRAELLDRALALGIELEELIERAARQGGAFRLRLARAHALSTIDDLRELVGEQRSREPALPSRSGVYRVLDADGRVVSDLVGDAAKQ